MRKIPAELVKRYEAEGWWTGETIGDMLDAGLRASRDLEFRVHSDARPWTGTVGEVERLARRLAAGLVERGVEPGDVVAMQLPNWVEAAAVFWASALIGAVVVPIVHFYGPKEVRYILTSARPKVFVTAERFGRLEYRPELSAEVPIVGVVRTDGPEAAAAVAREAGSGARRRDFEELLADLPMPGVVAVDPATPALIAFTSGTTRDPKGVVHSHRTLGCETRRLADNRPPGGDRQLTAAPVGHFIGMVNAFLIPVLRRGPINLTDVWDPAQALRLTLEEDLPIGGGAAYYLTSLLDHPDFSPAHLAHMKYAGMGGSAVPVALTTRLENLGVTAWRAYGSTEHPSITSSGWDSPVDKRLRTDGRAQPGVEIRLGADGEIFSRGPDLCVGYTDPDLTAAAFDADGWYRTGDIGALDADGYLTIVDRKADVIIRGGENVSALEVEDVLLGLPGVAEAAAVAAPDARLGEHVAAVLRLRPGAVLPTMPQLRAHFEQAGLARQKWPEEIREVADFPRTASGKVQKFALRADIAASAIGE